MEEKQSANEYMQYVLFEVRKEEKLKNMLIFTNRNTGRISHKTLKLVMDKEA